MEKKGNEGIKIGADEKCRLDLLPPEVLWALARVLEYGMKKGYPERNWEKGVKYGLVYGAAFRHLTAWWGGEELDPESNLLHLAHAMCCVMFLLTYAIRRINYNDDRPRPFIIKGQLLAVDKEDANVSKRGRAKSHGVARARGGNCCPSLL